MYACSRQGLLALGRCASLLNALDAPLMGSGGPAQYTLPMLRLISAAPVCVADVLLSVVTHVLTGITPTSPYTCPPRRTCSRCCSASLTFRPGMIPRCFTTNSLSTFGSPPRGQNSRPKPVTNYGWVTACTAAPRHHGKQQPHAPVHSTHAITTHLAVHRMRSNAHAVPKLLKLQTDADERLHITTRPNHLRFQCPRAMSVRCASSHQVCRQPIVGTTPRDNPLIQSLMCIPVWRCSGV